MKHIKYMTWKPYSEVFFYTIFEVFRTVHSRNPGFTYTKTWKSMQVLQFGSHFTAWDILVETNFGPVSLFFCEDPSYLQKPLFIFEMGLLWKFLKISHSLQLSPHKDNKINYSTMRKNIWFSSKQRQGRWLLNRIQDCKITSNSVCALLKVIALIP